MEALIADPEDVLRMHRSVLAARERLVLPMSQHVTAIEAIYRELADRRHGRPRIDRAGREG